MTPNETKTHLMNLYQTREEVKEDLHSEEVRSKGQVQPSERLRLLYAEYQEINELIHNILRNAPTLRS